MGKFVKKIGNANIGKLIENATKENAAQQLLARIKPQLGDLEGKATVLVDFPDDMPLEQSLNNYCLVVTACEESFRDTLTERLNLTGCKFRFS